MQSEKISEPVAERTHGNTSNEMSQALDAWRGVSGPCGRRRDDVGIHAPYGAVPVRRGPGSVDRGQEATSGALEREPSVLPGRALTESDPSCTLPRLAVTLGRQQRGQLIVMPWLSRRLFTAQARE